MRPPATTLDLNKNRIYGSGDLTNSGLQPGRSMNNPHSIQPERHAGRFRYSPGEKPLDGYTIGRGIGIGGFGEVYFALSDAGKEVALKRIQRNLDVELRGVQNCLNLKHPNLISLWDIRTDSTGGSWVVMEYVPGPSLREIVEVSNNGMPGHQIERWFCSIASAVEYLHNRGIVHRDLKPGNIFLDEDEGSIKIGDYGLSKLISSGQSSHQTQTVGTFHYMAPEVGKGNYGKGVDIYAMGIVLFEMLTGRVPFTGESSHEIIMKHLTTKPDLSDVPFDYRDVVHRALEKDPAARFANVAQMRECLPFDSPYTGSTYSGPAHPATPVINPDRMSLPPAGSTTADSFKDTVHRDVPLPQNKRGFSSVDDGILMGPLCDSTKGDSTNGPVPETTSQTSDALHYIGNDEIEIVEAGIVETGIDRTASRPSMVAEPAKEPIAGAVKSGWSQLVLWWNDNSVSTPLKVFVLLLGGFVIVANSQWVLPAGLALGLIYLVYYGFRNLIASSPEQAISTESRKLNQHQKRQVLLREYKDSQDLVAQTTSLISSLLTSAIVCVSLSLLGLAITGSLFQSNVDSWAVCAWSSIVSVVASWAILIFGKTQIAGDAEPTTRRVVMIIVGVLLGIVAFSVGVYLNVDLGSLTTASDNPLKITSLSNGEGNSLISCLLFFTGLFGLLRWWRQTDPTRRTRLSLWSVGLCLMWAALLSHALNFAPLWNCISIATIAIAVQLSSPWVSRAKRQAILERGQQ